MITERKFTPPTNFPAEYVTSDGCKAVLMAQTPDDTYPYIGWYDANGLAVSSTWGRNGEFYPNGLDVSSTWRGNDEFCEGEVNKLDLHDLPKKQVHWANDYGDFLGDWSDSLEWEKMFRPGRPRGRNRIAVIRREWIEGQEPEYFKESIND